MDVSFKVEKTNTLYQLKILTFTRQTFISISGIDIALHGNEERKSTLIFAS